MVEAYFGRRSDALEANLMKNLSGHTGKLAAKHSICLFEKRGRNSIAICPAQTRQNLYPHHSSPCNLHPDV
jgi:hypothetical protein